MEKYIFPFILLFIGEDPERIYADVNDLIARCKEA